MSEVTISIIVNGKAGSGKTKAIQDAVEGLRLEGWEILAQRVMQEGIGEVECFTCKARPR